MNTQQPRPSFDSDLQMFRENIVSPHRATLLFYRWLAEHARLEHEVFGPPSGECVETGLEHVTAQFDNSLWSDGNND
jgi:hypothetical protein